MFSNGSYADDQFSPNPDPLSAIVGDNTTIIRRLNMVKKKKANCSRVKTMIVMLLYALLSQLSAYLTLRNLLEIEITERDIT